MLEIKIHKTAKPFASRLAGLAAAAVIATSMATTTAFAGITDNFGWWNTAGYYVAAYHDHGNGDLGVSFLNGNGQTQESWYSNGSQSCSKLVLSRQHPQHASIERALIAAGLSQRPVHVVVEYIDSVCYLKQIRVLFRTPV